MNRALFEYVSKEFEIKNGEFRDARKVSPDQNGYYLVFYGFYCTGIPIEKSFELAVWPFVVGHGWNCTIREDGTVNDKNKIEIIQPTYWAPLTVIEKTKIENCPCDTCQTAIDRCGCQMHLCSKYQKWKEGEQ